MDDTNFWPGGSEEWFTAASVNWSWDPMLGYVGGFSRAGRILVDHLAAGDDGDLDFLVYPVVFCYRHAVEIALKQVIEIARRYLDQDGGYPESHNLADLWNTCRPLLKRSFRDPPESYGRIDEVISRLHSLDPSGEAFRYPFGTKQSGRAPTLPAQIRNIPLSQLSTDVDEVLALLDGADSGLRVFLDQAAENAEYEADMRGEYVAENAAYEADMRAEHAAENAESY